MQQAPLIALRRHRMATDGEGVTTLVAFHGCPLDCAFCLNPSCKSADGVWRTVTAEELLHEVMVDNLYFQATGGGICFGGGEPCMYAEFISEFAALMPREWNITLETSLNVDRSAIEKIFPKVNGWIVDVKDMNADIYKQYTGKENKRVKENLEWLIANAGTNPDILIRIPLIAGYNTRADVAHSRRLLERMGFTRFDEFEYLNTSRNNL